jgi:hypothetical protein
VSIPFNQLWTIWQEARAPLAAAIERVLRSGRYILAWEVEAFEEEFSASEMPKLPQQPSLPKTEVELTVGCLFDFLNAL